MALLETYDHMPLRKEFFLTRKWKFRCFFFFFLSRGMGWAGQAENRLDKEQKSIKYLPIV